MTDQCQNGKADSDLARWRIIFETGLGVPFTDGNQITPLRNGNAIFPPMLEAIAEAQHTIDFISFVYWTGDIAERFATALAERARAGVTVQVILDAVGAFPMKQEWLDRMRKAGVNLVWFRPPIRWRLWQSDNRTHRKVLICDAKVAFTGGVGIAKEWQGDARNSEEWRDTHFRITGPAVRGLQAAFIDQWAEAGRSIDAYGEQPACPAPATDGCPLQCIKTASSVNWSDIATLLQVAIYHARERIRITTAYFVPGDTNVRLLRDARRRGVLVDILVPGPHTDQRLVQLAGRQRYQELFEAGINLWEYQATMLHAKIITIDGICSIVGSANFNFRSMSKDDEFTVVALDADLTARLDADFDNDLRHAQGFDPRAWRTRGLLLRSKEQLTRLIKPQL